MIGTLNEGSLHATLKADYLEPGDREEVELDGFVIDIVRGEQLIEIQTASFGAMARKLDRLLGDHEILVVHPIASRVTLSRQGVPDRKSPKRGHIHDLFDELVSIPTLLDHPNFTLEVVLFDERRVKVHDPSLRRKRGGWRTVDRQLTDVISRHRFDAPSDLECFLPESLPNTFTTADMAGGSGYPRSTAQKVAYCLRALGLIEVVDRDRAGYHYVRVSTGGPGRAQTN